MDILRWYPPGHGDFYESFAQSGLLSQFIAEGRDYCFLSNIDNLGATVDLNILNRLIQEQAQGKPLEFVMEVTDKTRADVKVSTLNSDYEIPKFQSAIRLETLKILIQNLTFY